ncbi:GntR family transcriptional regulator [Castellaniella hirudinis]|uniref:GntR family transcriptional regulator n=1 Tax=Castellaniella hirudinis TaxID=1144617 RepID=UPI0039C19517
MPSADSISQASPRFSRRESKDAAIYEHLYTAIVEHHLEPGTRLPEDTLSENYGVSRTSVRKVLQKLAHDKLVDIRMHHGATVAQPSLKEARDLFASRRIIEVGVVADVIAHATPEKLQAIELISRQEHEAEQANNRRRAIFLSGKFHTELARLSGNDVLADLLEELVARTSLVIATFGAPQASSCKPNRHQEILQLISQGDVAGARQWMQDHLLDIERSTIQEREEGLASDLKDILSQVRIRHG